MSRSVSFFAVVLFLFTCLGSGVSLAIGIRIDHQDTDLTSLSLAMVARAKADLHNDKVLYDFADIESWDPDGDYYGDKLVLDDCSYDSDGNGSRDRNWAIDWQNSHTLGVDWFNCSCAHSQPLNGNRKAHWGHGAATEQVANSTAVPEPGVLAMLAICLVLVVGGRWGRAR